MQLPTRRMYPKTIEVAGETYKVRFKRKIPKQDGDTVGLCDPETKEIFLKLGQSNTELFHTFVHEVLHAMEFEYHIEIKHGTIYALEKAVVDLLLTNF